MATPTSNQTVMAKAKKSPTKLAKPAKAAAIKDAAITASDAPASSALAIAAQSLGPEQQLFNQLLEKIEKQSKDLANLKTLAASHASERAAKLAPLRQQVYELQEQLVLYLDQRLQAPKGLSQRVHTDVHELICILLGELLGAGDPSPTLQEVANRYEGEDDDLEGGLDAETSSELNRAMAQAMGVPVDGDGDLSTEDMIQALMRKMQVDDEAAIKAHAARQAKRKKSPKQKQAEQEELDAHSALRTIYRKLASALHPDRETDPAERTRKHQLMVRVNAANDSKDLLALLRLQMEVDQINPASVAAMADDKLRGFNRMLKSQLKDLQAQYQGVLAQVQMAFNEGYGNVSQKNLDSGLRFQTQRLQDMVASLQLDVVDVQDDKLLKRWAKHQLSLLGEAYSY
jgi:hypothetical protein